MRTRRKFPPAITSSFNLRVPAYLERGRESVMPSRYFQMSRWFLNRLHMRAGERDDFDMDLGRPLKIGITFFPSGGDQRLRIVQVSRLHLAALGENGGSEPRSSTRHPPRSLRRASCHRR